MFAVPSIRCYAPPRKHGGTANIQSGNSHFEFPGTLPPCVNESVNTLFNNPRLIASQQQSYIHLSSTQSRFSLSCPAGWPNAFVCEKSLLTQRNIRQKITHIAWVTDRNNTHQIEPKDHKITIYSHPREAVKFRETVRHKTRSAIISLLDEIVPTKDPSAGCSWRSSPSSVRR